MYFGGSLKHTPRHFTTFLCINLLKNKTSIHRKRLVFIATSIHLE